MRDAFPTVVASMDAVDDDIVDCSAVVVFVAFVSFVAVVVSVSVVW